MDKIFLLATALYKGSSLANVETWKKRGVAITILSSFLAAVSGLAVSYGWIPHNLSDDIIMQASSALVTLVGLVLSYLQISTTEKIGLSPRDSGGTKLREADVQPETDPNNKPAENTSQPRTNPLGVWGDDN